MDERALFMIIAAIVYAANGGRKSVDDSLVDAHKLMQTAKTDLKRIEFVASQPDKK